MSRAGGQSTVDGRLGGPPFPVAVTVDVVALTVRDDRLEVLLVRRGEEPHRGRWALPGGFVRDAEDLASAAARELAEETGVDDLAAHLEQLATYGAPGRDPRGRVVTVAYLAFAPSPQPSAGYPHPGTAGRPHPDPAGHPPPDAAGHPHPGTAGHPHPDPAGHPPPDAAGHPHPGTAGHPHPAPAGHPPPDAAGHPHPGTAGHPHPAPAGSDAVEARWFPVADLGQPRAHPLAFDHDAILADGIERARAKLEYSALGTAFCTEPFTAAELRRVYEAVWGVALDPRNFWRKVSSTPGLLVPVPGRSAPGPTGGRPAARFRRGPATTLHPPILRPQPGAC